uniref:Uncharacterized protein n=1 Tax=Oryza glaberrima TaxID=4538 RepID=I1QTP7_ORYGL
RAAAVVLLPHILFVQQGASELVWGSLHKATVYGARGDEESFVVRAQGISAIRPRDAEESAAHALISIIKKECRVEFDDTNWFDMKHYHCETEQLKRALGRARKKHNTLAKKARWLG